MTADKLRKQIETAKANGKQVVALVLDDEYLDIQPTSKTGRKFSGSTATASAGGLTSWP